MARIAGVNVPLNKRVEVGLTYIYGIGRSRLEQAPVATAGIHPDTYVRDLTEDEVGKLRDAVEDLTVEGDLRRERSQNIKRLWRSGATAVCATGAASPSGARTPKTNARTSNTVNTTTATTYCSHPHHRRGRTEQEERQPAVEQQEEVREVPGVRRHVAQIPGVAQAGVDRCPEIQRHELGRDRRAAARSRPGRLSRNVRSASERPA